MFWTIVGALLFVFVGIPIIITVLGWLGIGSISVLSNWFDLRNQRKQAVVSEEMKLAQQRKTNRTRWLIVGGGIFIVAVAVIGMSMDNNTNTVSNYSAPLPTTNTTNYYQEQINKNAELEKQRYKDYITKIEEKYPDKTLSTLDESWITNNLPTGVNFYKLKPLLIADGFEFIGYESNSFNSSTSKDYSKEISELVKGFKTDYPDLEISAYEEMQLRRNIPSYITYTSVKDEMLKQGFKFK
ncbi:MAG: hypothetical protein ACP5N7_02410 [Candidatus Pacearchaeota archaeon]